MRATFTMRPTLTRRHFLAATAFAPFSGVIPAFARAGDVGFVTIGDWGQEKRIDAQKRVASAMAAAAREIDANFVISLGDNFYSDGVDGIDDPKWKRLFEQVYVAPSLQCRWNAVLGNHDHRGNVLGEVGYGAVDARWHMPAPYYRETQILADGSDADFFYLDTTPIEMAKHGEPKFIASSEGQLQWLSDALSTSIARWKIVSGHHPVFSGGLHGNSGQLIRVLKPILDRNRVQLYIAGHDHDLQHVVVGSVNYVVCGSGAEAREVLDIEGTRFAQQSLGFMAARLNTATCDLRFIDADGAVLYGITLPVDA